MQATRAVDPFRGPRARGCLLALAVFLGTGVASAQVVVPKDWQRLDDTQRRNAEVASCAAQGSGALFGVSLNGRQLAATVLNGRQRTQDRVPYELDWETALTANAGQTSASREWAVTYAREHAARSVVPVDDGYLIGFGGGEYGGSLWWYPREPGRGRVLARAVVHGIVATPEPGVFIAITGLAHLEMNTAAAIWVERRQGQWQIRREVPLPGAPHIYATRSDGVLMADLSTVTLLAWNGDVRMVQRFSLSALAGSFAFGPNGEIAVGRSVMVSVLTPTPNGQYREDAYRPKECQKFTYWRGLVCMCSGAPLSIEP